MFFLDGAVVVSASDLKAAAECEFALLRALDAKLGRVAPVEEPLDTMLERAKRLGEHHEFLQLQAYRDRFGVAADATQAGVLEFTDRPDRSRAGLAAAADATVAALRGAPDVVFQGVVFDGRFVGYADFLVREGDRVVVWDTKLARTARVTALMQLAAYADRLEAAGLEVDEVVHLRLGDGSDSAHRLDDVLPLYRLRRARLDAIVDARVAADGPVAWTDDRYTRCGRCATCEVEVVAHRDLLLTAGMRPATRAALIAAGVETIDALAASNGALPGVAERTLEVVRSQASVQVAQREGDDLIARVADPQALRVLPEPDSGDVFFDFEGDPLYTEKLAGREQWNLDYLFGSVVADGATETFVPFWAHDFAEERRALVQFLDWVTARRAAHPGMHVYHYAAYERTHLQQLCARHGVGEAQLDALLRDEVLVDLYPIVKRAVRVSTRSYSLKKLEPLYMGDELRESEVTSGAGSVDAYVEYAALRDAGRADEAAHLLGQIADYNRYDCVSTLRLRDWLLARAAEHGVRPTGGARDLVLEQQGSEAPNPLRDELLALAGDPTDPDRTPDRAATAIAAAALDYHRRERKTFWWDHFTRLAAPLDDWQDVRDVFVVESGEVVHDWAAGGRGAARRELRLTGRTAPGSRLREGGSVTMVYEGPGPFSVRGGESGVRPWHMNAEVLEVVDDGVLRVRESLPKDADGVAREFADLPIALAPGRPIPHAAQEAAIAEWAGRVRDARAATPPRWPSDAATDLVRRIPPRGTGIVHGDDRVAGITSTLLGLDRSYLAVQGPPGTGKTWVGARVIAELVLRHGWKVGVVAQSHQVVEHMLECVVDEAGVPIERVGKKVKRDDLAAVRRGDLVVPYTPVDDVVSFTREHTDGFVFGGTAWDLANAGRVPRGSLDLLVVDEAGQFSLADTVACAASARNVLLLGDPQQLPQVSQGLHPEPVDRSALGWIAGDADVLPDDRGVFLAESWRMHPEVARAVSRLSYEGRLRAHAERTAARYLDGVAPGVHPVPVVHAGDATESAAEADEVARIAASLIGREWTAPDAGRHVDPLTERDLIVVAPYNAQVDRVRASLDAVGLRAVRVGTVDRFQGQEAVVAIVTLAASSAADVPRGLSFLLMPNRLNVAVSRAQWAAYVVHSPALLDALPTTPQGVRELSGFARLVAP